MKQRVLFRTGEQRDFFERVVRNSGFSPKQLADEVGVHRRTLFDWRREKLCPPSEAVKLLAKKYEVLFPEQEKILIDRWFARKLEICRKGAMVRFKLHGDLGTPEGRRRGGLNGIKKRRVLGNLAKNINIPEENENLAEFIGILLGDGGLSNFQCVIYLNSEVDEEYVFYVRDLIEKLFGLKPSLFRHKTQKVVRVMVSSINLIKYLEQKGLRRGNKVLLQVGVPEWILLKPEYIKACIRGLVDTDGCFAMHRYKVNGKLYSYPKIVFTNRSLPLLDFVHEGLRGLGYKPKNDGRYKVWLYNKSEVKSYLKEIGTGNFKKSFFLKNHTFWEGGPDGKAQVC
ncbi:hypothetical protein HYU92_01420 [Candidatus Curtissbacteria bacterium]|nr:hypothetical protein [Candidatus Curtissbacteria bacterium]